MNITQIRNATQLITYAGKRFLIDPMLAPKGAYPGFPGTAHAEIRNPMVELPVDVNTLLEADAVIVTHTHDDHWDRAAVELIGKDKPVLCRTTATPRCCAARVYPPDGDDRGDGVWRYPDRENPRRPARYRSCLRRARSWRNGWVKPVAWFYVILMRRRSTLSGIPSGVMKWQPTCKSISRMWWCLTRAMLTSSGWADYHGPGRCAQRPLPAAAGENCGDPYGGHQPLPVDPPCAA